MGNGPLVTCSSSNNFGGEDSRSESQLAFHRRTELPPEVEREIKEQIKRGSKSMKSGKPKTREGILEGEREMTSAKSSFISAKTVETVSEGKKLVGPSKSIEAVKVKSAVKKKISFHNNHNPSASTTDMGQTSSSKTSSPIPFGNKDKIFRWSEGNAISIPVNGLIVQRKNSWIFPKSIVSRNTISSDSILTEERRHFLRRSWERIVEKHEGSNPGMGMYREIFFLDPSLRKYFGVSHQIPLDDLATDADENFQRHSRVFSNLIDLIIRNIFEMEIEMGPVLLMYGRRHAYKHRIVFQEINLDMFIQGLFNFFSHEVDSSQEDVLKDETKAAWRCLLTFIVNKMNEGYMLETLHAGKFNAGFLKIENLKGKFTFD